MNNYEIYGIIAIQENQSNNIKLETPEDGARFGRDIVFQSIAKSPLYILKTFWPILLIFLLASIIKIVSHEKKRKKYNRDKKNMKWKKQPPNNIR